MNDQKQEQQESHFDLGLDEDNNSDHRSSDAIFEASVQEAQTETFVDDGEDVTYATKPDVDGYDGDPAFDEVEDYFQKHFTATLAGVARSMDYFEPAYRFGFEYGSTNGDNNLTDVDDTMREMWLDANPDTWDRFKPAVLYGWKVGFNKVSDIEIDDPMIANG